MRQQLSIFILLAILLFSSSYQTQSYNELNQVRPQNQIHSDSITLNLVDTNGNDLAEYLRISFSYYLEIQTDVSFYFQIYREIGYLIYDANFDLQDISAGNNTYSFDVPSENLYSSYYQGNVIVQLWGSYATPNGWYSFDSVFHDGVSFDYMDYELPPLILDFATLSYNVKLLNGTVLADSSTLAANCHCIDYFAISLNYQILQTGYINIYVELGIFEGSTNNLYYLGSSSTYTDSRVSGSYQATLYLASSSSFVNKSGFLALTFGGYHENYDESTDQWDSYNFYGVTRNMTTHINSNMFLPPPFVITDAPLSINGRDNNEDGLFDYLDLTLTLNSSRNTKANFWIDMWYYDNVGNYQHLANMQSYDLTITQGINNITVSFLGGQIQDSGYNGNASVSISGETYRDINGQRVYQWSGDHQSEYYVISTQFAPPPVRITNFVMEGQFNPNSDSLDFDYLLVAIEFETDLAIEIGIGFNMMSKTYDTYLLGDGRYESYGVGIHEIEMTFDGQSVYDLFYSGSVEIDIYIDIFLDNNWYGFRNSRNANFDSNDYNPDGRYNLNQNTNGNTDPRSNAGGNDESSTPSLPLPGFELTMVSLGVLSMISIQYTRRRKIIS